MVQVTSKNALERFVGETRELFAGEADPVARWTAMRPILATLLADPDVVAASKKWPNCTLREDGRPENLLFYEDPDFKFVVNGLVVSSAGYGPRGRARIHDHGHIYTLYGVLDGHQVIERYERLDDRSKPDYAEIRHVGSSHAGPGEIDLVGPYEIHTEIGTGERAVALIVRSEKNESFNQGRYVPENRYFESLGPVQTRLDLYSSRPR